MTETTVMEGDILVGEFDKFPGQSLHRVLELIPRLDTATLIPIPDGPRTMGEKKQASYYARGFWTISIAALVFLLDKKTVRKTTLKLPDVWHLPDSDLRKLQPPISNPALSSDDRGKSPLELKRNFKWSLIEPLVARAPTTRRLPTLAALDSLVRERAKETHVSPGRVFDALHRYFAFGCIRNALLPNNFIKSGAPGKPRLGKNNIKLGRKNAAFKAGMTNEPGLILDDNHIQNIQDGYAMYVRPGITIPQAFRSMSATFYCKGYSERQGHQMPDLLEAHLRPTIGEFKDHGPRGGSGHSAARRLMGDGHWARNYRNLCGSATDGVVAIGHHGSLDASPVDVNFVACCNSLQPIGVGRGLFVRDALFGLYVGWNVSIGGVGTNDAKLAILRGATDKTKILARYCLNLPADDFPSLFFAKYHSDNGELRSIGGVESIVDNLESRIEFIKSNRPDLNSVSESGHHTRHRKLDHPMTGSTHGRQANRGEPLAIKSALLSRYEYVRLLLFWMHWANTKQQIPIHMVPFEMRREYAAQGKAVNRTRIEIYRWAKENGYVASTMLDPDFLRAQLLPKFTASITRSGLILHRPNTGNAVELLHGARFNDEYLAYSGVIRDAMVRGQKHIDVSVDPEDLSQVLLMDKQGVHIIRNVKDDILFINEGSIPDLCALNDDDKVSKALGTSRSDQDELDQQSMREETEADAKAKRKLAKKIVGTSDLGKAKRGNVRQAQAQEKRDQLDEAVDRATGTTRPEQKPPQQERPTIVAAPSCAPEQPLASAKLIDIRKANLIRFNNERKF